MKRKTETEMEKILTGDLKTDELNKRLEHLSSREFSKYLQQLKEAPTIKKFFDIYSEHYDVSKSDIVKRSGLSRSYAYELLNGIKTNPSRDHLIALCLGAEMDLSTTQYALKVGAVGELYAKVPRDAAIILFINQKKFNIIELNLFLEENGMELI